MFRFHNICGNRIKLSNDSKTAERIKAKTDFNDGIVFSDQKLETNVIFQVRIDKRLGLWSGSLELGVTKLDPNTLTKDTIPQSATELRSTWLYSSGTILQDGEALIENYGFDLEQLGEGDTVGLMRTSQGELIVFINGTSQGVASSNIPEDIFVIVNLYGKCSQVTIIEAGLTQLNTNTARKVPIVSEELTSSLTVAYSNAENNSESDKLRFHEKCGPLVKLSQNHKVAERRRPMEEFNNAVVLTHRPLREGELFQIRIDHLVQKWSGSLEFGLTTINPIEFEFPATITTLRNGTVMSGNGILHNGKATTSPYTNFNLDQLQEGARIGVVKNIDGDVNFYVNGVNQGIAANITQPVYGCLNLYGMAAKVTIVDRNEREEHNLRVNVKNTDYVGASSNSLITMSDSLSFHPNCGFHAAIINNGRTAHRPNAKDDFNHGVVLTNRTLKPNELFEVVLDKIITKWAGNIEIGVTTHMPTQLDYPCTMTNLRSGTTYIMTGNGIMQNGVSILDEYGSSLDKLKVGDRVGVLRKESGNLHFFINGVDQGCAATDVTDAVYGVIDLYGQAAMATIVSHESEPEFRSDIGENNNVANLLISNGISNISNIAKHLPNNLINCNGETFGDLRFHNLCGRNARISNNGLTASRPNALGEFNAAIVISSRPLRDNELFEVIIERMVERWSGNLEAGVTTIRPEELVFPNTMTDIDHDAWMLSGSSIMTGGATITNRYKCNLDTLQVGSRVGMMRRGDGSLYYFINGEDQGVATEIPPNVYGVFDLYGQCASISLTRLGDISMISSQIIDSLSLPIQNDQNHRFSSCTGKNILLKNNNLTATRSRHYSHGLVFSSLPLEFDEIFEIRITEINGIYEGALAIGLTTLLITDDYGLNIPPNISGLCPDTWFITGSQLRKNNMILKENYCPNLNRLSVGDRVGLSVSSDRILRFFINGEEVGNACYNLPKKFHVVVDLFGSTKGVTILSTLKSLISPTDQIILGVNESHISNDQSQVLPGNDNYIGYFSFDTRHGKNIELLDDNTKAKRVASYTGIVFTAQVLHKGTLFQVRIDKMNPKWSSSLIVGVIDHLPDKNSLPITGLNAKRGSWVLCEDCVFQNGIKIKSNFGPDLSTLQEGDTIGLLIDYQSNLILFVNENNQGIVAEGVTGKCRGLIDVYGQCEEISILNIGEESKSPLFKESKESPLPLRESKIDKVMERSQTEKNSPRPEPRNCEYLSLCTEFKNTLFLPDAYFVQNEEVLCYCEICFRVRGDIPIQKHGDPPAEYSIPVGWVRYPININLDSSNLSSSGSNLLNNPLMTGSTSSMNNNVLTTWHVAFHGLRIPQIRRIMDFGQLIPDLGDFACYEFFPLRKDEKTDGIPLLYFSPLMEYASIPHFSPKYDYFDHKSKRQLKVQVALQLFVKPSSYKRGPRTHSYSTKDSYHFPSSLDNDLIEWSTKEQHSTHVSALLIRILGF